MQRKKASAGVDVKQVIGALCRLLTATGLDAVPAPESFRRAKFGDGPEVEGQFWQLLINIFQTIDNVPVVDSDQPIRDLEQRQAVAAGLRLSGFRADWLCEREEEVENFSSRDLLLAVSWLLATGTLEKLLMHRVQQLDKTLLTPLPAETQVCPDLQVDPSSLRRLQWLRGSLRHQQRILLSSLEERARLLHNVLSVSHSATAIPSGAVPDSSAIKQDTVCVKQLCDLLQSYLNWKQVESVFWSWMDSVMDCHHRDPVVKEPQLITSVCEHNIPRQENRLHTAQTCRVRLEERRPFREHTYPAGRHSRDAEEKTHKLPAPEALQLLLHTEAALQEDRDRQRLENRLQLQELIGELEGLVLIPP